MELRKVQVLKDRKWYDVEFMDLKNGDIFRMFEPDGKEVRDEDGQTEFTAVSDVYMHDEYKVWTIDTI